MVVVVVVGIGIPFPPSDRAFSYLHHHLLHVNKKRSENRLEMRSKGSWCCRSSRYTVAVAVAPALLAAAAAVIFSSSAVPTSTWPDTLSDVPQTLSAGDAGKQARIQRPRSRKAESCTIKCVTTCIRGGAGSPGEGPLNVRRPLVVFKQGFRSRQYCLVECSDICNLIKDGEDGP